MAVVKGHLDVKRGPIQLLWGLGPSGEKVRERNGLCSNLKDFFCDSEQ